MGLLYNKESVLQHLVNKTQFPEASAHIKSLKDIKELKLTPNPAFKGKAQNVGGYMDDHVSPHICPLVGLEMNDRSKFCFLWKCGCVMSERGLKLGADNKCVNCVADYEEDDIVILNPTTDDIDLMKSRLVKRKEKLKSKKNKHIKQEFVAKDANLVESTNDVINDKKPNLQKMTDIIKVEKTNFELKIKTEKTQTNVDYNLKKEQTKRTASAAGTSTSNVVTNCRKLEDPIYKKAKITHSIAKDESATNVFKSLFTSHEDDKNQTRAHWITYNPFYN
ncbi:replication termination factor 2 isoform X2 [Adelges cooleyi]|nr:replication termination factor 2 isoform X2 [Adelges cooleyi]